MDETLTRLCGSELARIVEMFSVALAGRTPGTCEPGSDEVQSWRLWLGNLFEPLIARVLSEAHGLASEGRFDALERLAEALDAKLPPVAAERSRQAGWTAVRRVDWPERRRLRLPEDACARTQLPIVFGMHTALFHIPRVQAMHGYLWLEGSLVAGGFAPSRRERFFETVAASLNRGLVCHELSSVA